MTRSWAPLDTGDKFAFGLWCLQNRGRDPFGDQTRSEHTAIQCVKGLAERKKTKEAVLLREALEDVLRKYDRD